ncbi:uncharacterized protein EAE97_009980 [Botrytis byssoidea]|uniref:Uncharacterized protein n=1 Tax=Botrytis byssoidea TaxID=139641 RepID=A0A9P5LKX1_9HELO|nr:uncharacterized protein EAE97_009980 [Botrytis byssoidea]KAF7927305.1 hypothetical protein EAE97_009980 [Botrytis byssoidea]
MVASVNVGRPLSIELMDHITLELKYQSAINKFPDDEFGEIQRAELKLGAFSRDQKTVKNLTRRLEEWSMKRGILSESASEKLTPEFIRNHDGLDNYHILKNEVEKKERKRLEAENQKKETSGKKPQKKPSRSHTSESSRR